MVESLKDQLTSEDYVVRGEALRKLCESDVKAEEATVLLEFAKVHLKEHTFSLASKLGIRCVKADASLRNHWITFIVERLVIYQTDVLKIKVELYRSLLEAAEAFSGENEGWMAGFGASFKNEKDPECLELIFRIVKAAPHITLFPLLTVYFPITLRADSTKGEHLKALLKDAFKRISELEEGGIVFEFLVERMEAGSTYAIMDALDYLKDIRIMQHWKRMFMLTTKALIDDRFDCRDAAQQLFAQWFVNAAPPQKEAMLEHLEGEIKSCLANESSLLATRGVSELIKVFGQFSEMNGLIEYCLANIGLHDEGSRINNNNKTALLAALISTEAFRKEPVEQYLLTFLGELVEEQKQVIFRLSLAEAFSRKHALSKEIVCYVLDLGNMFLQHSMDERGKQFVQLILRSLIKCNSQVIMKIFQAGQNWNSGILELLYTEECTGKAITEYAMQKGDMELLKDVLKHYEGSHLSADVCEEFLRSFHSTVDKNVLKRVSYHVKSFDDSFGVRVLSWLVFYASKDTLIQNSQLVNANLSSLATFSHAVLSTCNKLNFYTDLSDISVIQALVLKGDDRGYSLFNNAIEGPMSDLEALLDFDINLLQKAHFEIHPAYQQKFLANVNVNVNVSNYFIWLRILSKIDQVDIIPKEQAIQAAFSNLTEKLYMKERIALLKVLHEQPTPQFLESIDLSTLDMHTRIQLIEYLAAVGGIGVGELKRKIKRVIDTMLDDKKYLVRQAACKAVQELI